MNAIAKRALVLVLGLSLAVAAVAGVPDGVGRPPFSTGSLASGSTWSG